MKRVMLISLLLVIFAVEGISLTQAEEGSLYAVFNITINLFREPATEAEQKNIFTITVAYPGSPSQAITIQSQSAHNVLYFLDDRFEAEFKAVTLPFSFKRNFRGQSPGVHTVRIDIEDGNDNVLATSMVTFEVIR